MTGQTSIEALTDGLEYSDIPLAFGVDEEPPVAMFGVGPLPTPMPWYGDRLGVVWMLGTDGLRSHARAFLRECRPWVDALHTRYPILWNVVDARNTLHIRWLNWADFTITTLHEKLGVEGRPFFEFIRRAKFNTKRT